MRRTAFCALLLAVVALPAGAAIVEYTGVLKAGLGDGGDAGFPPDISPNGLPLCNKGLITHLNASVPVAGFLEVGTGAAPQSIMAVRPFKHGTAGATGPAPTSAMPGVAGVNGGPIYTSGTCSIAFTPGFLPAILNARTQMSSFSFPADKSVQITTTISGMRNFFLGTGDEMHTLAAGGGPGNFVVSMQAPQSASQFISGMAGANQFGGGFRASGGGNISLNVGPAPGVSYVGSWPSGPRILGHGMVPNTQVVTMTGTFTNVQTMGMVPVQLKVWLMPLTTGMVHAEDHGGQFTTIRDTTGNDGRNPAGTTGTLTMVTPWTANLLPFLNLYFGGSGISEITLLPEPGATAMLGIGVLGVIAMHVRSRRRK